MNNDEVKIPGLWHGLRCIVRRDLLLAWKRPGDVLNPLFFFAMVSALFPLAVGPSAEQLAISGPGVLWVAALLAALLSLNSLFLSVSHWLVSGLPLVIVSPLVAMTFRMPVETVGVLMVTLVFGTISLSLLGSIGAALTVGLNRGNALLSLLILPLAMPVLIFGARTVSLAAADDAVAAGIYFLAAYCMLAVTFAPFAAAAALKISNE
jgi:heme exporter protein B